jgi:hypothetical protein
MKDARGYELRDGDICLIPVRVSNIHTGHASAVSLLARRTDGAKDTFYVDTGTLFKADQELVDHVRAAEVSQHKPVEETPQPPVTEEEKPQGDG